MVLQNYVILQNGTPARVHFTNHRVETRTITDPTTGRPKSVNVLAFEVDRLNGNAVSATYSTTAEKHAAQFAAYLSNKSYVNYEFIITQRGDGFQRAWTVDAIPFKR